MFILQLLLIFNGKLLFSFLFPAFALLFCVPDLIPRDVCVPDELVCCFALKFIGHVAPFTWQLA